MMANMRTACLLVFASMSASMSAATFGADIFKWVDEKGRIQYGESVPAKYAKSATKIDPGEIQPQATEAQRQEAAARAAKDKADAQSLTSRTENTDKPSRSVSASTDNITAQCEAEKKKFRDSEACFPQYRTPSGAIVPEAFRHCVEVKEPTC